MSTEIKVIKGSCHVHNKENMSVKHGRAEVSLTRFFNGGKRGSNIQLTVQQIDGPYGTSYIHLTNEQCKKLAKVLLDAFDYDKYPSD